MSFVFDPTDPGFCADPYPAWAELQWSHPAYRHEGDKGSCWFVTRHADCAAILKDARFSANRFPESDLQTIASQPDGPLATIARVVLGMMLVKDAPDHTRLRSLVNKAFTPRVVADLAPRVRARVDDLVGAHREAKRMDIIADFAVPLPIAVISELLGFPIERRAELKRWSGHLVTFLDGTIRTDEGLGAIAQACSEMDEVLAELFAERRASPKNDLISRLVHAQEAGDALTNDELLATVVLILAAGHETTTNLVGNGMLALLRNPDQLERLRVHPELIRPAVEELLRYDPPVQITSRHPTEDLELHGAHIRAGEEVDVVLAAANRDPAVFEDPHTLDIARAERGHLAFGLGAHFCLGAALARLEGQIGIQTLVQQLPGATLESETVEYKPGFVMRSPRSLPVRF